MMTKVPKAPVRWRVAVVGLALVALCSPDTAQSQELGASELEAISNASSSYAEAWLANDADRVMDAFVPEPVLSPSGLPFLEGHEAARGFWFPADSPPTRVTGFSLTEIEVGGSGTMGYTRGTYELAFEYNGASYVNLGKYLSLLRKTADGSWRISHHFWNDLPKPEEP